MLDSSTLCLASLCSSSKSACNLASRSLVIYSFIMICSFLFKDFLGSSIFALPLSLACDGFGEEVIALKESVLEGLVIAATVTIVVAVVMTFGLALGLASLISIKVLARVNSSSLVVVVVVRAALIYAKVNRWEICVAIADGQFKQLLGAHEGIVSGRGSTVASRASKKKLFSRHLKEYGHDRHTKIAKLIPKIPKLKWRTKGNHHDCGIFTMLHMECYNAGAVANWDCGLVAESGLQLDMLRRLRFKFATKILLHEINVHAQKMLDLAKEFDKLESDEKMSIIVNALKNRKERDRI
ncbi:hypothetical protein Tco_0827221 [Tanacetum coccineum]